MNILKNMYYLVVIILFSALLIYGFVDIFGGQISNIVTQFKSDIKSVFETYPIESNVVLLIIAIFVLVFGLKLLFSSTKP